MALLLGVSGFSCQQKKSDLYLQQASPGLEPAVFAEGNISLKEQYEFGSVFSRDGKEFYYAVEVARKPFIQFSRLENGQWTPPTPLLKHEHYGYNDPFLSPDEQKLFFISDRALDGAGPKKDIDIWYVERKGDGWSEPINAGSAINSDKNEYYISFTSSGTMYFSSNSATDSVQNHNYDIYTSQYKEGAFQPTQRLGSAINSEHYEADVFVAPDESYLIYCAERPDGYGQGDLWMSLRDENGQWQRAKNLGDAINTKGYEFCPFVSADGKYLFFSRDGDIYWVEARLIGIGSK